MSSREKIPGTNSFIAAEQLEAQGRLGTAATMYEQALAQNFAEISNPVSAERGMVGVARERLVEIYGSMAEAWDSQGRADLAGLCRARQTFVSEQPSDSERWDDGMTENDTVYIDPE